MSKDLMFCRLVLKKWIVLWRDDRGTPHLRGRFQHWRSQGAWQTEEQFSDGTLRLMGLLWAAMEGGGPLLLEEPELSLHPEIVRVLPQIFARMQRLTGRQIFISTHSPDLLRDDGTARGKRQIGRAGLQLETDRIYSKVMAPRSGSRKCREPEKGDQMPSADDGKGFEMIPVEKA